MMAPLALFLILLLLPVNGGKLLRRRAHDADPVLWAEAMMWPDHEHRSLKKGGKGESQDDVSEGCVGDVQTFQRSVLVNFVGVPEQLDADQIMVLEDAFKIAYNRLGEVLCDEGSFRVVVDVEIAEQQQRRLQFEFKLDFKEKFALLFQIVFQSNSGGTGANIFGKDAPFQNLAMETISSTTLQATPCAPCDTPTPEIFIMYSNNVLREIAGDTLHSVITVDSVSELEEVSCEEEVSLIETSLAIEFYGNPDEASPEEQAVLAQSLRETFNSLNGLNDQTCDLLFRVVVSVEAELDKTQTRRNLQDGTRNSPFVSSPFLLFFKVIFQCRGCHSGTTLLMDDAARRLLPLDRHLQAGGCLCPMGIADFRPPSRDDFDATFNQTVTILIAQDEVRFVTAVGETAEIEEISCLAQVDDRQTQLVIEADGDPDAVTDSDITTLEETIKETLLDLFSQFCDPEVRNVLNVQFDGFGLAQSRELQSGRFNSTSNSSASSPFNSTSNNSTSRPFLLSFTIVFSCRGCPFGASLFGNDASRRLLPSNDKARGGIARRLQSNGTSCFCDVNVVAARRAPTETEFEVLFQDTVQDADLTTNVTIRVVTETEATSAPTSSAPVTPQPVTPQPVSPQPVTPQPVSPQPVSPQPVSPQPVSPQPVTLEPATPQPITLAPTTAPVTQVPSAGPSSASILLEVQYEVAFRGRDQGTLAEDLIASMDILAAQVVSETFPDQPVRRRLLMASMVFPTNLAIVLFLNSTCPNTIPASYTCLDVLHSITLTVRDGLSTEQFQSSLDAAMRMGRLQSVLNKANPNSSIYITKGLAPVPPLPLSQMPVTSQPTTAAPVTSDPTTSSPVTSDPTTSSPVTPRPVTTAPVELEVEKVSCEEVSQIETSFAINFIGNPDESSPEQQAVLAQSLRDTVNGLNGLNDQICDPLFREVLSVEAELLDTTRTRRNLQGQVRNQTGNSSFTGTGNSSVGNGNSSSLGAGNSSFVFRQKSDNSRRRFVR